METKVVSLSVGVYYRPPTLYCIDVTLETFDKYLLPYVCQVMSLYVGYCTLPNRNTVQFESSGTVVPSSDVDTTSGN